VTEKLKGTYLHSTAGSTRLNPANTFSKHVPITQIPNTANWILSVFHLVYFILQIHNKIQLEF